MQIRAQRFHKSDFKVHEETKEIDFANLKASLFEEREQMQLVVAAIQSY